MPRAIRRQYILASLGAASATAHCPEVWMRSDHILSANACDGHKTRTSVSGRNPMQSKRSDVAEQRWQRRAVM